MIDIPIPIKCSTYQSISKSLNNIGKIVIILVLLSIVVIFGGFVDRLSNMLITHEIPAELLELEVTESAVMRYPELTLKTLHAIRALGVKLSIDDFGTGYASLAYLKQLPVQCLKIDKTFIDNLSTDEANQRIVKSAIHLAHEFSMIVVAEGVEQQSAAKILIDLGCELGQGYLYSKPLAPDLFEEIWLSNTLH